MDDYLEKMVSDALTLIDAMTIDELEDLFKSCGMNPVRKPEYEGYHQLKPEIFNSINVINIDVLAACSKNFNCDNDYQFEIAA